MNAGVGTGSGLRRSAASRFRRAPADARAWMLLSRAWLFCKGSNAPIFLSCLRRSTRTVGHGLSATPFLAVIGSSSHSDLQGRVTPGKDSVSGPPKRKLICSRQLFATLIAKDQFAFMQ